MINYIVQAINRQVELILKYFGKKVFFKKKFKLYNFQ